MESESPHVPERFDELPPSEQARLRAAMAQLAMLSEGVANWIAIGDAADRATRMSVATCFAIRFAGEAFLLTAAHVFRHFKLLKKERGTVRIQAGNLAFNPAGRVVFDDSDLDIAAISLSGLDLSLLDKRVYDAASIKPIQNIAEGDFVQFCGFPAFHRQDAGPRDASLVALAGFVRVADAGPSRMHCHVDRNYMLEFGPGPLPPAETVLGGLSGSPVLFRGDLHYPVVGLVSQFLPSMDVFRCAVFTSELQEGFSPPRKIVR